MPDPLPNAFSGNVLAATTVELGIAQAALDDAAEFFRTRAPLPPVAGIPKASEDPHVILRFGQLQSRLHAAQGLLARAKRLANTRGAGDVAAIEARAFAADLVAEISTQVITWGSPLRPSDHRQAEVIGAGGPHAPHNANHWNYHFAGNYYLKGIEPPRWGPEAES